MELHVVIHIQLLLLREIHFCDSPAMFKWQLAENAGISLGLQEMKEIDNTRGNVYCYYMWIVKNILSKCDIPSFFW